GGDRAARPADRVEGAATRLPGSAFERGRQAPGTVRSEHRAAGRHPPRATVPAPSAAPADPGTSIAAGRGNAAPAADADATTAAPAPAAAVLSGAVASGAAARRDAAADAGGRLHPAIPTARTGAAQPAGRIPAGTRRAGVCGRPGGAGWLHRRLRRAAGRPASLRRRARRAPRLRSERAMRQYLDLMRH